FSGSVSPKVRPIIREVNTPTAILWDYGIRYRGKVGRIIPEQPPPATTNRVSHLRTVAPVSCGSAWVSPPRPFHTRYHNTFCGRARRPRKQLRPSLRRAAEKTSKRDRCYFAALAAAPVEAPRFRNT